MAVVATYSSWAIVSGYENCVPVAKFWNHDLPGHCLSFEAVWFFNASMNIATDVTLLLLPMPGLIQLQLPRMQKMALMGVFAIGILYAYLPSFFDSLPTPVPSVVITSILRLSSLRTVAQSTDTSCTSKAFTSTQPNTHPLKHRNIATSVLPTGQPQNAT